MLLVSFFFPGRNSISGRIWQLQSMILQSSGSQPYPYSSIKRRMVHPGQLNWMGSVFTSSPLTVDCWSHHRMLLYTLLTHIVFYYYLCSPWLGIITNPSIHPSIQSFFGERRRKRAWSRNEIACGCGTSHICDH